MISILYPVNVAWGIHKARQVVPLYIAIDVCAAFVRVKNELNFTFWKMKPFCSQKMQSVECLWLHTSFNTCTNAVHKYMFGPNVCSNVGKAATALNNGSKLQKENKTFREMNQIFAVVHNITSMSCCYEKVLPLLQYCVTLSLLIIRCPYLRSISVRNLGCATCYLILFH